MLSNTAILSTVEIETLLSDIRGRLLLHARNETIPEMADDIFSWTQRLFALVELTDGVSKKDLVQTLAETIFLLPSALK